MCQSKIIEAPFSVSQTQEPIAKMLRPLDGGQAQKKGKLVSRWIRDENSKLYCQWFFE